MYARGFAMDEGTGIYEVRAQDEMVGVGFSVVYLECPKSVAVWFDVEHLDQFIASLQEARAVLVGEAGGQLTQEQAEAAAGMEPLDDDEALRVYRDGPLAGVRVHPWPDEELG